MRGYLICSIFFVLYVSTPISGYGGGAPSAICGTMVPDHGSEPQKGPNPFKVLVNKQKVEPDGIIEITLDSISGNEEFIGFLVQVRKEGVSNKAYGEFIKKDDNAKPLACFGVQNNAMTHKDPNPKKRVTVQWIADPKTVEVGEYRIHTTFVKDKNTYWTNQLHDQIIEVFPPGQAPGDHPTGHEHHDEKELCSTMNLNPKVKALTEYNPYKILVEKHDNVEQNSRILINATSEIDTPIMTLFMQVRRPGSQKMAYGEFVKPVKGAEGMSIELIDCFGAKGNAILFRNPKHSQHEKISDVSLLWKAPGNETGNFEVVSTILSEEDTFWGVVGGDQSARKITVVQKKSSSQKPTSSGLDKGSSASSPNAVISFATTIGLFFVMMFAVTLHYIDY